MSSTNRGAKRTPNDAYYTPDELARKLVALLPVAGRRVWEPHAGGGAFVLALHAAGASGVVATDIDARAPSFDMPVCARQQDFLRASRTGIDWIVGNPPFQNFEAHIDHALTQAPNVAFLLRLAAMETKGRIACWKRWPLRKVWVLAERPSFTGSGTDSCAYGFFRFERGFGSEPTIVPGWSWKDGAR